MPRVPDPFPPGRPGHWRLELCFADLPDWPYHVDYFRFYTVAPLLAWTMTRGTLRGTPPDTWRITRLPTARARFRK